MSLMEKLYTHTHIYHMYTAVVWMCHPDACVGNTHVCMYVCIHVCMYVYMARDVDQWQSAYLACVSFLAFILSTQT